MATTVNLEFLNTDPLRPSEAVPTSLLPGGSDGYYLYLSGPGGLNNVTNHNPATITLPLSGLSSNFTSHIGAKFPAVATSIPSSCAISGVTVRAVFTWPSFYDQVTYPFKLFASDQTVASLSSAYSGAEPTNVAKAVAFQESFALHPTGVAWTPSNIADVWFGLLAGYSGLINLLALTIYVAFELPTITPITSAAINIRRTRADLQGSIDPLGATSAYPVTVWFQYNKTGTFKTTDPTTSTVVLTGSGSQAITIRQTGLTPGAVYAYRLVARNGAGDLFYGNTYLVALPMVDDVIMRF